MLKQKATRQHAARARDECDQQRELLWTQFDAPACRDDATRRNANLNGSRMQTVPRRFA
jgi:hypothetical protein